MKRRGFLSLAVAGSFTRSVDSGESWLTNGASGRWQKPAARSDPAGLLAEVTRSYRLLEATTPSPALIAPAQGHLALARQRLAEWEGAGVASADARACAAAASEIASFTAWLQRDLNDLRSAWGHYHLSVEMAQRSGHPFLAPYQMASLARLAAEAGDARQGLAVVDLARSQLRADAPPAAHGLLFCIEALAHTHAEDRRSALTALDAAEQAAMPRASAPDPVWPWLSPVDYAKVSHYRMLCAARMGDIASAEAAAAVALPKLKSVKLRARALIDLARAYVRRREVEEACRLAMSALDLSHSLDSKQVIYQVTRLRRDLGTARSAGIRDLDGRLAAVSA
jgi:tetratricopeptide (TPR) repeat protein